MAHSLANKLFYLSFFFVLLQADYLLG